MKVVIKTLRNVFTLTTVLSLLAACSFPFSSVNSENPSIHDISAKLDFFTVSRQGFMGGSVFYNPEQPSTGQLAKGVNIAIRLGHVQRVSVDSYSALFSDVPEEAKYGSLLITEINKDEISFLVKLYNANGESLGSSSRSLCIGESLDIDDDGLLDIQYKDPVRKRTGLESAIYLNFLSSQENLNTSMFAVLPEQYNRGVYPNGIIGINPEGKFIISKYEGSNATRSVVTGVQKGDYVLDSIEGKYQKVISSGTGRNARSIADSEVEDIIDVEITVSYKFTEADFTNGYNMDLLFNSLPLSVREECQDGDPILDKLNSVLLLRNLISTVAQIQETPIPGEDLDEVLDQISNLEDDEVVQLNRIFLEAMYPETCPGYVDPMEGMAQVLPLASLIIGEDSNPEPSVELNRNVRAASGSEFDKQRAVLEKTYEKYKTVFSKNLESPSFNGVKIVLNNSFVKIGVKGSFSASWGNIDSTVDGVVFLSADTNVATTIKFTKNLFSAEQKVVYPVLVYGPIVFKVTASVGVNVPLTVSMPIDANFSLRAAFAGLYEGGVKVGLDYGIRWKKKWIIKVPVPYCDGRGSTWSHESTIYYVGSSSSNSLTFSGITATINPNVNGVLRADISDCVYAQVVARAGLTGKLAIIYVDPTLTGTATVNANAGLTSEAGIGLKVPVINKWYGKKWNWNLIGPYDKQLASWQVFKTTL